MCALSETKLKGRGEVKFGEGVSSASGGSEREGERRGGPFTE